LVCNPADSLRFVEITGMEDLFDSEGFPNKTKPNSFFKNSAILTRTERTAQHW